MCRHNYRLSTRKETDITTDMENCVYVTTYDLVCDCERVAHEINVYTNLCQAQQQVAQYVSELQPLVKEKEWVLEDETPNPNYYCAFEEGYFECNNLIIEIRKCPVQ